MLNLNSPLWPNTSTLYSLLTQLIEIASLSSHELKWKFSVLKCSWWYLKSSKFSEIIPWTPFVGGGSPSCTCSSLVTKVPHICPSTNVFPTDHWCVLVCFRCCGSKWSFHWGDLTEDGQLQPPSHYFCIEQPDEQGWMYCRTSLSANWSKLVRYVLWFLMLIIRTFCDSVLVGWWEWHLASANTKSPSPVKIWGYRLLCATLKFKQRAASCAWFQDTCNPLMLHSKQFSSK